MQKPVVLAVLDGWGLGPADSGNPLTHAQLPTLDKLAATYPLTSLEASGIAVGLPWGEVGNSEVGHLTIGAGMVLYQHYPRISLAIRNHTFDQAPALAQVIAHLSATGGRLHLAGLISDGNVHASIEHVRALYAWAQAQKLEDRIWFHAFGDGKDSPKGSMEKLLAGLPQDRIATAIGRHYAMNRDEVWQLTQAAYTCMTSPSVEQDLHANLEQLYAQNLSEEFLTPTLLKADGIVRPGDAVIFWNFREDSIAQIASCFVEPQHAGFSVTALDNTLIATMTAYKTEWNIPVLFPPQHVENPLGRVIADSGLTQLRIAETYKHAHVTSFFNGYREEPFTGEYRVLIPSRTDTHPDEHPELVASQLTDRLELALQEKSFGFVLINYANGDVIAHTGNFDASVKAAETVDAQLARLLPYIERNEVTLIITGDHGNIERVRDPQTGRSETTHDKNPVPFYLCDAAYTGKRFYNQNNLQRETGGTLADIAPTILELMGIQKPQEMHGVSLLKQLQ